MAFNFFSINVSAYEVYNTWLGNHRNHVFFMYFSHLEPVSTNLKSKN